MKEAHTYTYESSIGPIQVGIPPETIKDSLHKGMPVPKYFVIQGEMFDRKAGLSKAEFEFPIYYQYFVARSRVNILTTKELELRIRKALKETLIGPGSDCNVAEDYPPGTPADALPVFDVEALSLDPERNSTKLDDVVNFILFDDANKVVVEAEGSTITIQMYAAEDRIKGGTKPMFEVKENEQVLAHVPSSVKLRAGGTAGTMLGNDYRESTRSKHAAKQQLKKTYEEEERLHLENKPRSSTLTSSADPRAGPRSSNLSATGVPQGPDTVVMPVEMSRNGKPALTLDVSSKVYEVALSSQTPTSPTPRNDLKLFSQQFPKLAPFDIPIFGITMMGASHGFDASGRTTGFVLWMNRRGIMVDPPPDSSQILEMMGVPPLAIEGIILTHTHADHDAGTFQRILRTRQIKLYTTRTVERSFINKYSAITGFDTSFLRSLFTYIPVQCGDHAGLKINGGEVCFFYSLHTIPCIGFEAYFGHHSLVYSADTRYDPEMCQKLYKDGKIGKRRADQLSNFPYNHTVILHELGVPPIHTPKEALEKAAHDEKHYRKGRPLSTRLFVVHASEGAGEGFAHQCKDWDTIRITVEQGRVKQLSEIYSVISNVEWLEPLGRETLLKIAKQSRFLTIDPNEIVVNFQDGEPPQSVFVVLAGLVHSTLDEQDIYTVGDFFGEEGILADLEFSGTSTKSNVRRLAGVPLSMEVITSSRDAIRKGINSVLQDAGATNGTTSDDASTVVKRRLTNKYTDYHDFPAQTFKTISKAYVVEMSNKVLLKYVTRARAKKKEVTEKLRRSNGWPNDARWAALQRNAPLVKLLTTQFAVREFLENLSSEFVSYPEGFVLEDGRGSWNPSGAYFVKEGVLRVTPMHTAFSFRATDKTKLPGHNETIHSFDCARGSLVGDFNALIKKEKSPFRITCVEECEVYHFELKQLQKFFEEFPGIKFQLIDRVIIGWMLDIQGATAEQMDVFGGIVKDDKKLF